MKKVIAVLVAVIAVLFYATTIEAKPATDTCSYIQGGILQYAVGHYLAEQPLTTGYDIFGYNYQAHIFNGSYANAYLGRPGSGLPPYTGDDTSYLVANPTASSHWTWPFRNVQLQMKWNDAWLANKDCNDDGVLDRSNPYQGSGAWLTNHATGTYTGSKWEVNGSYVLSFDYLGSFYVHDMTVTSTDGTFTGTGSYPSGGPTAITWTVTGSVTSTNVAFHIVYDGSAYTVDATGTIAPGGSLSGSWTSNAAQSGTWTATTGTAVHPTCTVSDFVKIIAPPSDAYKSDGDTWYNAGGSVIGPDIWGEFAIIQEIASDPCEEYEVINYMSPLKKGLGGW